MMTDETWPGVDRLTGLEIATRERIERLGPYERKLNALAEEAAQLALSDSTNARECSIISRAAKIHAATAAQQNHLAMILIQVIEEVRRETDTGRIGEIRELHADAKRSEVNAFRLYNAARRDIVLYGALGLAIGVILTILCVGILLMQSGARIAIG